MGPKYFLQRMTTSDKYFCKPYFQGIFVMDPDYVSSPMRPPWYGDTIRMQGWDFLKIPMGKIDDSEEVLTRKDGWLYIYNYTKATFDAIDASGNTYIHRNNIQTIGDLHIDFTIQMSHQFEIYFDASDISAFSFFRIFKLKKKNYGESYIWKPIISKGDKLYGSDDRKSYVNSTDMQKRIASIENYIVDIRIPIKRVVYEEEVPKSAMPKGITEFTDNDKYMVTTNKLYDNTFKPFNATHKKQLFKAVMLKYSMLYFMLSHCMYPRLNITIRQGENHNNRPVYEPWLIWGVFKFLFLHREEADDDGYEIDVFDLSPNCSY